MKHTTKTVYFLLKMDDLQVSLSDVLTPPQSVQNWSDKKK